jgi:hypothetical protein
MPFGAQRCERLYECIEKATREARLTCLRGDKVPGSGRELRTKIHELIVRAEVVIAEISEPNVNVYYEFGYAAGLKKTVWLLAEPGTKTPSDIGGLEYIPYDRDDVLEGGKRLREKLREHFSNLNSDTSLLRDMLEATDSQPIYIVSSPKYPNPTSTDPQPSPNQAVDSRTFGDNLGIKGLLTAFGALFGETDKVELVSGQHCDEDLKNDDVNLFLIGSARVNKLVEPVLKDIQSGSPLVWEFRRPDWAKPPRNPRVLYKIEHGTAVPINAVRNDQDIVIEDRGLLIRAPHPVHPNRFVMIMAGAHSLGTGAACLAATRSSLIRKIKEYSSDVATVMCERGAAFWVLLKAKAAAADLLLDIKDVEIDGAGVFKRARSAHQG